MEGDETRQLFYEDVAGKKSAARGARHRASRTGKIGRVNLPADFLGKAYTKSGATISFSVDDVLYMLQETPTLKELLMQRLDAEYEHYKLAIERTLDAVARIQETALSAILSRLEALEGEIRQIKEGTAGVRPQPSSRRPRTRSADDVRERVFDRIAGVLQGNPKPDLKSVAAVFPGIRYYIYQLKIWPGFREMLADFREWENQREPEAAAEAGESEGATTE